MFRLMSVPPEVARLVTPISRRGCRRTAGIRFSHRGHVSRGRDTRSRSSSGRLGVRSDLLDPLLIIGLGRFRASASKAQRRVRSWCAGAASCSALVIALAARPAARARPRRVRRSCASVPAVASRGAASSFTCGSTLHSAVRDARRSPPWAWAIRWRARVHRDQRVCPRGEPSWPKPRRAQEGPGAGSGSIDRRLLPDGHGDHGDRFSGHSHRFSVHSLQAIRR